MIDFGLSSYDDLQRSQDDGVDVPVYNPGSDAVLFTIRVHGPDSAQQDRARERQAEESALRGQQMPLTRDEILQQDLVFLARCCSAWTARDPASGAAIPFTEEAAVELFRRYRPIRAAVDGAAANRARFIRRSPTASAEPSATN
ncbi:hypothetical protein [Methylobacterium isbiliense]|uniref:Uncharacterized protein n=1 Tax=Methylobacterium isbiliense TaxID=315478 RepID=A0ABQ4SDB9_9HYPH|nr:hypothetical protein [Methylobacterium isbiliense]MDN3622607.1 hypothetical protein [Methylobacterium isbiliense]GJE00544.1 hypothetical protein GMJLKIPL_2467 [Methylobacterium isbiliense]